jgi:hypothetical protein
VLTEDYVCTVPGDTVDARIVLENAGATYGIRFMLDKGADTTLAFVEDIPAFGGVIFDGVSQTGLGAGWFSSASGSKLHILTVRYVDSVGCASCEAPARPLSVVPDPGSVHGEVLWYDDQLFQDPEYADGDTAFSCHDGLFLNLQASSMITPTVAAHTEDISAGTGVTVRNLGSRSSPSFAVRLYHSADAVLDAGDTELINGTSVPLSLGPGDSAIVTFPGLAVPDTLPTGAAYLLAFADYDSAVAETDEADNTLAAPVTITPYAPNVIVSQMTTPAWAEVGSNISASTSVTVKNVGTGATPPFTTTMMHSIDDTITGADLPLVNGESVPIVLGTNESLAITFPGLEVPLSTPGGAGYLGALADFNDTVTETDETDNDFATSVFIDTQYVNLVIAEFIAPPSADLGDTIDDQVMVKVTNLGNHVSGPPFDVRVEYRRADSLFIGYNFATTTISVPPRGATVVAIFPGFNISRFTPSGPGLLWAKADRDDDVSEIREDDNDAYSAIVIGEIGDTVCVYFEDFSNGPGGWIPVGRTGQESYWHVAQPGLTGSYALHCSTVDSSSCGGAICQWEGYGHSWRQRVRKSYAVPAGGGTLEYDYTTNTEWGFDYLYFRARTNPADTFATLREYNGVEVGTEVISLAPYAGQTVEFEVLYQSDASYDDQDGLSPSGGLPVILDNFLFNGTDLDNFELGTLEGWIPVELPPTPGGYRLVESPACFPGYPACDTTSTGEAYDACNVWVPYDSLTGLYPYLVPDPEGLLHRQSIAIESPTRPLPTDGNRYYLEADVYFDVPFDFGVEFAGVVLNVEYTFNGWEWETNHLGYIGDQGWDHLSVDISDRVIPWLSAGKPLSNFAFRWGASELTYPGQPQTTTTPGPYFNNISIKIAGTSATGVSCTPSCSPATGIAGGPRPVTALGQNFPNPFNPTTTISFSLAEHGPVQLRIYDVDGRLVRSLVDGHRPAGQQAASWNGTDNRGNRVASGVYFYRLHAGAFTATRKMVILK